MKNKIKYFIIFPAIILGVLSCNSQMDEVLDPSGFQVTVSNKNKIDTLSGAYVINQNDTVKFAFNGYLVDNIVFYSGELGQEFRYRNRWLADTLANLTPSVELTNNVGDLDNSIGKAYSIAVSSNLGAFINDSVVAATWSSLPLRSTVPTVATSVIDKFNFVTTPTIPGTMTLNIKDWYRPEMITFRVRAKSNKADKNRLIVTSFVVKNTETRDYSYIDPTTKTLVTITSLPKDYFVINPVGGNFANIDGLYRVTDNPFAVSWAQYTPLKTIKEGETTEMPNSQWYCWNVAELGLKYGEGSGYPWVTTNKYGQLIRCTYNVEIFKPNINIPQDNGLIGIVPTAAMMLEPTESWLISRKINTRLVAPDASTTVIKTKVKNLPTTQSVIYKTPGLYTASFYVYNQDINDTKAVIRQIKILVLKK